MTITNDLANWAGTGSNTSVLIANGANVGIGNTNPAAKLHVHSTTLPIIISSSSGSSSMLEFQDGAATTNKWRIGSGSGTTTDGNFFIYDQRQTATRMVVDTSGNMGIGTTAPANSLDVQNNLTSQIRVGYVAGGATAYYDFGRDSADGLFCFNGAQASYVGYKWKIQGTERMRIDSSGNLLLGTTTALVSGAGSVSFVGSTTNRCWVNIGRATASTTGVASSITGWNGTTQVCSIDFNANGANNSGLIQTYTWSAGSAVQGPYVTTGGTSWTTASDENLKDIIEPIENGVEKLSSLRSVIGKFKTDHDDVRRVFLIAQDVQAVLPEAIVTDTDGHLGLNYQDMIPLLVKAIQELSAKNQELLAKNGDIEQRLALLEANK